ncbi:MAG: hypothetical protein GX478_04370 [Erysipelotrichaceae bacterium]|jgi:hypothetical protein|nr:hypothetical protein [Erysipelotrichaceae bacterium]
MSRNEWIGLGIYAAILVILCFVFAAYQIIIAILGMMGFTGYMRTRHLVHKYEK